MTGSVNEVLRDIIDRHGRVLLDDHRRCESCLHDSSLTPKEIAGAMAALKAGVPKRIVAMPALGASGIANLAAELAEASGLNDKLASQSVEAWAFALQAPTQGKQTVGEQVVEAQVMEKKTVPTAPSPQPGTKIAALCVWIVSAALLLIGFFAFGPSPAELNACIQSGGSGQGCGGAHFPAQLFWLVGLAGFGYGGKLWLRK